ncbi:TPA: restriction endonuclease subunit S [Serratia marcescens]|uniref:restriction endonuclease subunit S n=1 Tax=Serratia marcescens TaxID=615 RepID=UPI000B6214BE|nr:restriction endonuclease subunit S [Serratia marcescens]ASM10012.1 hypothetical protein BVG91_24665 [Serratia marcescens]ELN4521654.1 restriction endonuclease subunit S [Serratia marcescens]MBH2840066.1 restriction endonuclease subunit S [Serratia marcescens]MDR4884776.1 restriction endonuclease subunit S [Serratia marcescens]HEJ7008231.1 restriction endonuclease subunit S [Serratia marcescens]
MRSNEIFNNFPSDWYSIPLGQLVKESNGIIQTGPFGSQLHAEDYVLIGTPSIMPKNISVNGVIDTDIARIKASDLERLSRYQVKKGDIIYSRRGDVEKCALISERENGWLCGTGCILIRLGNSDISPEFLHAYLSHPLVRAWIVRHAIGATMPNLNTTILSELPVLVPTKKIRKCIKENWTSLTKKILINSEINQTLEQMAQALFKSWFVDFEPVKAKITVLEAGGSQEDATLAAMTAISGKDADALVVFEREHPEQYAELKVTAELFPSAMQDSELGEIPEGWEVSDIKSSVSELRRGISPKYTDDADGIMVINQKCIRNHTINFSLARRHDGKIRSTSGRELQIGDILVNSTGVGTLGRLAPVRYKSEILIADSHVTVVRADTKKITKSFLSELLKKHEKHIESSGSGSTGQTELRKETLEEIKFPCPPVILGQLFDEIVNNFNKKISIMEEQMIALSNLRDTLLPKLLSGEITLPEAEQAVSEAENV